MSEQEKSPIRKILTEEFKNLKEARESARSSDSDKSTSLKNEISEIEKQGQEMKKTYILLNKLKGQTIDNETLEQMIKYMEYLKGQKESVEIVVKAEEALAAAQEASNMFEEAL